MPVKKGDEILVDDVCITVLNDRYEPDDDHVGEPGWKRCQHGIPDAGKWRYHSVHR